MVGIISGVSQGPMLFKIFINEPEKELSSKMTIFCDMKLTNKAMEKKKSPQTRTSQPTNQPKKNTNHQKQK